MQLDPFDESSVLFFCPVAELVRFGIISHGEDTLVLILFLLFFGSTLLFNFGVRSRFSVTFGFFIDGRDLGRISGVL